MRVPRCLRRGRTVSSPAGALLASAHHRYKSQRATEPLGESSQETASSPPAHTAAVRTPYCPDERRLPPIAAYRPAAFNRSSSWRQSHGRMLPGHGCSLARAIAARPAERVYGPGWQKGPVEPARRRSSDGRAVCPAPTTRRRTNQRERGRRTGHFAASASARQCCIRQAHDGWSRPEPSSRPAISIRPSAGQERRCCHRGASDCSPDTRTGKPRIGARC